MLVTDELLKSVLVRASLRLSASSSMRQGAVPVPRAAAARRSSLMRRNDLVTLANPCIEHRSVGPVGHGQRYLTVRTVTHQSKLTPNHMFENRSSA